MSIANYGQLAKPDSFRVPPQILYIPRKAIILGYSIIYDTIAKTYSSRNSRITRASSSGLW